MDHEAAVGLDDAQVVARLGGAHGAPYVRDFALGGDLQEVPAVLQVSLEKVEGVLRGGGHEMVREHPSW